MPKLVYITKYILRFFVKRDQSTILRLLLETNVTPNDKSVQTLLLMAANRSNSDVIRVLLHTGDFQSPTVPQAFDLGASRACASTVSFDVPPHVLPFFRQ